MCAHTLEQALDRWLADYVPFLRADASYRSKAKLLRPLLKGRTIIDATDVAVKARNQWRGLKPATVNRRLAVLRRITNLAFEWGWVEKPVGRNIKLLPERNERHYYLTRADVERLRAACTIPEAGDLIVFAAFTGLRTSEILRVTAQHIIDGALHLDTRTKNGRPRVIPLHPRALAIGQRMPLAITPSTMRAQWDQARIDTGLMHIQFHDLRHTFASWLIQQNTPLPVIKELLGHSTINMTMRYAHLSSSNLKSAVETL